MEYVFCPYHFHYQQLLQLYLVRMYHNRSHCCLDSCLLNFGSRWRWVLVGLGAAMVALVLFVDVDATVVTATTLVLALQLEAKTMMSDLIISIGLCYSWYHYFLPYSY